MIVNKILLGNVVDILPTIDSNSVDLFCYSPPYNVNIPYSDWDDDISMDEYWKFTETYLRELYRIGKDDTRYCINLPYTINRGGEVIFIMADYHQLMLKLGFKFHTHIDLDEDSPHRKKNTAWGSWLSPSAPYIFNSKECVIVYYKNVWKKQTKGTSYFDEYTKKEFINLVQGNWKYKPQTTKLTEANFSLDIPSNVLKLFAYKEDLICDPFMGSGTTGVACKLLGMDYIGVEISEQYKNYAEGRIGNTANLSHII